MPRHPVAALLIAGFCSVLSPTLGQTSESVRELLRLEPKSHLLRLNLADRLSLEGDAVNAGQVLQDLLAENPGNPLLLAKIGYSHLNRGRYDEARKTFQELLQTQPHSLDARYGLIRLFEALLDWDRVKTVARDIMNIDQKNYFATLHLAWADFNLKNYAEAYDTYNTVGFQDDRSMRLGRGWCLIRQKRFDEARTLLQKLCQDLPYDSECLKAFKEADLLTTQKDLTQVAWAQALSQSDVNRYLELAKKSRLSGKCQDALDLVSAIVAHDPRHLPATLEMARIYGEMGNWTMAEYYYAVYLNRQEDTEGLLGRITALRMLGRFSDAARVSRRLLERDPKVVLPYLTLGDYHYQIGEFQNALEFYQKSPASETLVLQGKGWSLLNLKRFDEAKRTFEEVLSSQPGNQNAQEGLREIQNRLAGKTAAASASQGVTHEK